MISLDLFRILSPMYMYTQLDSASIVFDTTELDFASVSGRLTSRRPVALPPTAALKKHTKDNGVRYYLRGQCISTSPR